jgi:hypothetical protein
MWTGDLSQLKVLVKDELNVTGQWSSPGGDVNRFWGESVSIKWNQDNKELKILGKNKQAIEQRLDIGSGNLLIPQLTNVEGTDNDYGCPETRNKTSQLTNVKATDNDHGCSETLNISGNSESPESCPSINKSEASEARDALAKVCNYDCECVNRSITTELEGIKLDIAILEGKLLPEVISQNASNTNLLKAKQANMEAIIQHQEEMIHKRARKIQFLN